LAIGLFLGIAIGVVLVGVGVWMLRQRSAAPVETDQPPPLLARRDEQERCLRDYLALSTKLVGCCADMDEIHRTHAMPRDRVTAAERYAEQRGAGLYGRACLALGGNLAADMLDALCATAAARFDPDVLESELRARRLHEQCQRDLIAVIHQTERALGLDPQSLPVESAALRRGRNHLEPDRESDGSALSSRETPASIEIEVATGEQRPSLSVPRLALDHGANGSGLATVSSVPPSGAGARPSRVVNRLAAIANASNDSIRPPSGFREYHVASESQPPRGLWSIIMEDGGERLVPQQELERLWQSGEITSETNARKEGMVSYARLGLFHEFRQKKAD
jgi:hypothetical protein